MYKITLSNSTGLFKISENTPEQARVTFTRLLSEHGGLREIVDVTARTLVVIARDGAGLTAKRVARV